MTIEALFDPDDNTINMDGKLDSKTGVQYIGKAQRNFDGMWVCLANVGGALCFVEVLASPLVIVDHDPGDEDLPHAVNHRPLRVKPVQK
jgi:hypothetical protein